MILLFAFACSTDENLMPADALDMGPQPTCDWSSVEIGLDEDPGLGFSAGEVLALASGPRTAPLKWDWTGETTLLHSDLSHDGAAPVYATAVLVDSETGAPWEETEGDTGEPADVDQLCPPHIELGVAWTARTEDGRLDEALSDRVSMELGSALRVEVDVDYADLGGSGIPMEIDPVEWDSVSIEFVANCSEAVEGVGGSSGELAVTANRTYEDEETATDEGYVNDVARWPWEE